MDGLNKALGLALVLSLVAVACAAPRSRSPPEVDAVARWFDRAGRRCAETHVSSAAMQCASACGQSFCNGQQPSAACEACLTSTCEPAADALCTGAACQAGAQCLQTSNCDAKP